MSRAVFVLSLPRSGSSAVAGALHRLGVDMGEGYLQVPDASNERGYYEDLRWQAVNKSLAGHQYAWNRVWVLPAYQRKQYRKLAALCSEKPLWGVKAPRMAFTFHLMYGIVQDFAELRVVYMMRDQEEVIDSIQRHSEVAYGGVLRMDPYEAANLIRNWQAALDYSLRAFAGPVHVVEYESLLRNTAEEVNRLIGFVYSTKSELPDPTEAIEWIDPSLKHQIRAVASVS